MRDAAFAELLVTTGVRLEEGASLLIGELPTTNARVFHGCRSTMIDLPARITKGRKPRSVPFPRRVASNFIDAYIREERSQLVDRWRRAGGVRTMRQPLIGTLAGGQRVLIKGERRPRSLATLRIDERRNLLLLPGSGAPLESAQPAALWLAQDGQALTPRHGSRYSGVPARSCRRTWAGTYTYRPIPSGIPLPSTGLHTSSKRK